MPTFILIHLPDDDGKGEYEAEIVATTPDTIQIYNVLVGLTGVDDEEWEDLAKVSRIQRLTRSILEEGNVEVAKNLLDINIDFVAGMIDR